jgi:hypothetical protein
VADHSKMKLGRKPKKTDPRTLKASRYMLPGAFPAPRMQVDWMGIVPDFPLYGNDIHSDCGIAAIGHMVQWWTAQQGSPRTPLLEEVMAVYDLLSPQDDGCYLLDVLKYWRKNPICGSVLGAFAEVDFSDQERLRLSLDVFGGIYTGLDLPRNGQTQEVWDFVSGSGSEPASWGRHCVPFGRYSNPDGTARCATWGAVKDATFSWLRHYLEECYVLIDAMWLNKEGQTPAGIDIDLLNADLALVEV